MPLIVRTACFLSILVLHGTLAYMLVTEHFVLASWTFGLICHFILLWRNGGDSEGKRGRGDGGSPDPVVPPPTPPSLRRRYPSRRTGRTRQPSKI